MLSGALLPIPKAYYRQLVDWMMEVTPLSPAGTRFLAPCRLSFLM